MLSDDIKYQIDFAKKSSVIYFMGKTDEVTFDKNILQLKKQLDGKNTKKISIVNLHECLSSNSYVKKLQSIVDSYADKEIYISSATSTRFDNFFNPIVNIFFWKNAKIRFNISNNFNDVYKKIFDSSLYIEKYDKKIKGILSVRRETQFRDYLFSIIDKSKFDGIIRYAKWPDYHESETIEHVKSIDKFPNFLDLINEYKSSYISFVVETDMNGNGGSMNPLTEKTLIPFLTKTMPIVLGGKNYIKELKEMGFYVWNDEFGFESGDVLETFDFKKIDLFNKCILKYNSLKINDIDTMYNKNIDKIIHNYNLVSEILFTDNTKKNII